MDTNLLVLLMGHSLVVVDKLPTLTRLQVMVALSRWLVVLVVVTRLEATKSPLPVYSLAHPDKPLSAVCVVNADKSFHPTIILFGK